MNIVLWILQGLLALVFLMAGVMKSTRTKEQLGSRMAWVEDFSPTVIRLIGLAELLGALGLILPAVTGILPWLTPLAATGLVLVMAGASFTHYRRKEFSSIGMTLILLILAGITAVGRFWMFPL
jgi:uncharacterized membrane protein